MSGSASFSGRHYTFERDNRELQLQLYLVLVFMNYTFERDNRELQPRRSQRFEGYDYTFERDNRELQRLGF